MARYATKTEEIYRTRAGNVLKAVSIEIPETSISPNMAIEDTIYITADRPMELLGMRLQVKKTDTSMQGHVHAKVRDPGTDVEYHEMALTWIGNTNLHEIEYDWIPQDARLYLRPDDKLEVVLYIRNWDPSANASIYVDFTLIFKLM